MTHNVNRPGGGLMHIKRIAWHAKSLCILNMDVPEAKAIAWLESLPDDNAFVELTVGMGVGFDFGMQFNGCYHTVWIALAHEKVGLWDGALRFADLSIHTELFTKSETSQVWPTVMALLCKGRVFAKLGRHADALAAFEAAIIASKESYIMMQAFAYQGLANYAAVDGSNATAAQAANDLGSKLKEFDGRLTTAEFEQLRVAP